MIVEFYNERINGRIRFAMIKPPAMNEMVAINDGS
jgi:hypothetical protein